MADFDESIRLDSKESDFYMNRATLFDELGDYEKAEADINTASRLILD